MFKDMADQRMPKFQYSEEHRTSETYFYMDIDLQRIRKTLQITKFCA
jgi:hypothetical protein